MSADRIEEWLRKMGYDGPIPSGLSKICNPSTSFIWEQLISNIKPRQEARNIKHNLIVNRLSKAPLDKQKSFSYPIKEIEIYVERKKLEQKIQSLETQLEEKDAMIDNILKKNKKKYIQIDNMKAKIKENKEKTYLLQKKAKLIQQEMYSAEETLTLARNLTPVEVEHSSDKDEITKTLQKCAEKLQKISDNVSHKSTKSASKVSIKHLKTPKVASKNLFKCVNESLNDLIPSNQSRMADKENVDTSNICANRTITFLLESVVKEETKKRNGRESLGLLSEDFDLFVNCDNDDSFLKACSLDNLSTKPENCENIVQKFYNNETVKHMLKDLLHKNNRNLIMTQWKHMFESLMNEITCAVTESIKPRYGRSISQEDWTELHFTHIKSELQREKHLLILKRLQASTKKQKEELIKKMPNKSSNVRLLELQMEEAYLIAATNFLRREINCLKKREPGVDLNEITAKIEKTVDEIGHKREYLQELMEHVNRVLEDIRNNQEEFGFWVKKLNPYFSDLSWAAVLEEDVNTQEVDAFKAFPLEFNRSFETNQLRVYCRNICDTTVPSYVELESGDLETLAAIMDLPCSSAESLLFKTLKSRLTLDTLIKASQSRQDFTDLSYKKYSQEELSKQEDYVEPAVSKLSALVNSAGVKEVLSAANDFKEVGDLWLEMPFRNFISDKRSVDGHKYEYYENVLKNLQNGLS